MLKPYTPLYSSKTSKDMVMVLCSSCAKQVPKVNIELHKLKCTAVDVKSISKSKKKPSKVNNDMRNKSQDAKMDFSKKFCTRLDVKSNPKSRQ